MKLKVIMSGAGRDWQVYRWMSDENGVEWTPADQDGPDNMREGDSSMLICSRTWGGTMIFGQWDGEEITIQGDYQINEYVNEVIRLREGGKKHQEPRPGPSKFELYRAGIDSDVND